MVINIDIDKINSYGLGPSEYCIIKLLYDKEFIVLESMVIANSLDWVSGNTFKGILEHLQIKNWLKIGFTKDLNFKEITLREKSNQLFEIKDSKVDKFLELWTMYPRKVPNRPPLRAANHESDEFKILKKKWLSIVKNKPNLPDIMIRALDKQLRDDRNNLQYMQMFSVWLNKSTWEKYMDFDEKPIGDSKVERL